MKLCFPVNILVRVVKKHKKFTGFLVFTTVAGIWSRYVHFDVSICVYIVDEILYNVVFFVFFCGFFWMYLRDLKILVELYCKIGFKGRGNLSIPAPNYFWNCVKKTSLLFNNDRRFQFRFHSLIFYENWM